MVLLQVDHSWGEEIAQALIPAGIEVDIILLDAFVPLKAWTDISQMQANIRRGGEVELWVRAHFGYHGRDHIRACHQNNYSQVINAGIAKHAN